mmetsp:Transcript_24629/g.68657  ORF Transcript_24629/g.68657 Transcript_24629/m.68657 type:complete len:301 (+) Transcript_24629:110-1012(+)|eukprot:CAMPEP_0117491652 /NCGR_PEP_ID=MMETSP0784-20121206/18177_1 /TAXON_ID=39447 /ORGANISM="" /LENGTH=300 /DNA_ID=CAMNT_0005286449 /DNA_START=90 /DNA_END=992 /DNA_ORIENTATION=+
MAFHRPVFTFVCFARSLPLGVARGVIQMLIECERWLDTWCRFGDSFTEPAGNCQGVEDRGVIQPPPPARTLFPGTTATELGLLSRSLRFGRLLWCLARQPTTSIALDFYGGTGGGSTLLLSHGLAQHAGTLYSFERDDSLVAHAITLLRAEGMPVGYMPAFQVGQLSDETGTWMLHGEPVPHHDLVSGPASASVEAQTSHAHSPLRELCERLPPVDLVVLDPMQDAMSAEWPVIERFCKPVLVAIHNVNLPGHAGWIRDHLLRRSTWYEALNGSHPSAWDDGGLRGWTLLQRLIGVSEIQ